MNEFQQQKHNEMARRRWKMLARALQRSRDEIDKSTDDAISVRRISSFGLLSSVPLENILEDLNAVWFEYNTHIGHDRISLKVRHLIKTITPVDLMGFNNTGNICIWPSEEVLAYYSLCNKDAFTGKTVLELGGGMTCLAGLFIAKYTKASFICLTDGNISSVNNVRYIVEKNGFKDSPRVKCSVLQWGHRKEKDQLVYDIILAADCLFFDDGRLDLVKTIWGSLADNGLALVTAPRRGKTLDKFMFEAENVGFRCTLLQYYNKQVWDRHLELKSSCPAYDEDIHYPLLLHLMKPNLKN